MICQISKEQVYNNILSSGSSKNKDAISNIETGKSLNISPNFIIKGNLPSEYVDLKPCKTVISIVAESNKINVFNFSTLKITTLNLNISNLIIKGGMFYKDFASINVGYSLYISGGVERKAEESNQEDSSSLFLIFNSSNGQLKRLPDMLTARHSHSIIHFKEFIYAVGGCVNRTSERFSLKTLKWEPLPSLNSEERQKPVLFGYKNFIYAFFGHRKSSSDNSIVFLDTIERLNINSPTKWENIPTVRSNLSNPDDLQTTGAAIIPIGQNEILLFGGKTKNETSGKRTVVKFNLDTYTFYNVDEFKLDDNLYFEESMFVYLSDFIWGHFNLANESVLIVETIPH